MDVPEELFLRAEAVRFEVEDVEERRLPRGAVRLLDHRPAADRLTVMHAPVPGGASGALAFGGAVRELLLAFVRAEAARTLPRMLADLAVEIGAPVPPRVRIAEQRTRWASRSTSGTVSCNLELMFLPRDLVRHVLLHELSHIAHMNHGPQFHALLARLDPLSRVHEASLRTAARNYVPAWTRPLRPPEAAAPLSGTTV